MQPLELCLAVAMLLFGVMASPVQHLEERSAPVCGLKSYDYGRHILLNKSGCSLAQCAALCKSKTRCYSYGYGKNVCRLYSIAVKENVQQNRNSPYKFYDKACSCPATTTTRAITRATATTSVSTSGARSTSTSTLQTTASQTTGSIATSTTASTTGTSITSTTALTTSTSGTTTATTTSTTTSAPPSIVTCNALAQGGFEEVPDNLIRQQSTNDGTWYLADAALFNANEDDGGLQTTYGSKFISFGNTGPVNYGDTGALVQTLSGILPGQEYLLSYSYALQGGSTMDLGHSCTLSVSYAGQELDSVVFQGAVQAPSNTLTTKTKPVSLSAESGDLKFGWQCDYRQIDIKVVLDNISLTRQVVGGGAC
ncbi:unnamed protein product [Zymoseptoria tritici ST99CH_1E4]|uniref:Apple domain-containing protein n=1 Tax=Zymoseptoria tritici ST99CH_1E4 TaxID=1276532 RepID=A0A2H1H533_ZYMTR|nr:unnamed protein product [Zymoseptoria tritici ST99CH_1E4]